MTMKRCIVPPVLAKALGTSLARSGRGGRARLLAIGISVLIETVQRENSQYKQGGHAALRTSCLVHPETDRGGDVEAAGAAAVGARAERGGPLQQGYGSPWLCAAGERGGHRGPAACRFLRGVARTDPAELC